MGNSGRPTKPEEYPYAVEFRNSVGLTFCGGTVIGLCVLTAEHCLRGTSFPFSVDRGALSGVDSNVIAGKGFSGKPFSQSHTLHPSKDLALLKLDRPFPPKNTADLSILVSDEEQRYRKPGTQIEVVGFGPNRSQTYDDGASVNLGYGKSRVGKLSVVGEASISADEPAFLYTQPGPDKVGPGDSGSGVFFAGKLFGVLSAGTFGENQGEGDKNLIAGNKIQAVTLLAQHRDWIEEKYEELGCEPKPKPSLEAFPKTEVPVPPRPRSQAEIDREISRLAREHGLRPADFSGAKPPTEAVERIRELLRQSLKLGSEVTLNLFAYQSKEGRIRLNVSTPNSNGGKRSFGVYEIE
ncbi:MAG: S1 family peptidase [Bdellovibrionota bacterium]